MHGARNLPATMHGARNLPATMHGTRSLATRMHGARSPPTTMHGARSLASTTDRSPRMLVRSLASTIRTVHGIRAGLVLGLLLLLLTGCPRFHAEPLPGAPADATFVAVDGVHVRYREAGQ